jgi:hypothetical protein
MQAVADALSLLANIVMAWNTAQMQQVLDHWAQRRGGTVPPELIGRIAPTRTEGINLRGIFRFPVERYVDKILPSVATKTASRKRVRSQNRAAISLVNQDQNPLQNQTLARWSPVALGKYGLPLPYVIARKMRGPRLAHRFSILPRPPLNRSAELM